MAATHPSPRKARAVATHPQARHHPQEEMAKHHRLEELEKRPRLEGLLEGLARRHPRHPQLEAMAEMVEMGLVKMVEAAHPWQAGRAE